MSEQWTPEEDAAFRAQMDEAGVTEEDHWAHSNNGTNPADEEDKTAPAAELAATRVNLFDLIRDGVPDREFVPGTADAFAAGKRHHVAGESKAGKTLSIGLILAIDVVLAGGVVVILDRENGADEYSRRLASVLNGRRADEHARKLIESNYHYHAWPQLKLEWGKSNDYPEAFAGTNLVIFDNSRKFLSSLGLKEDSSDEFTEFAEAIIDPLMKAGIATAILDNSGYSAPDRPRGSSSKPDHTDVMFALRTGQAFNLLQTGWTEMECKFSRIGEISGKWKLELGGGTYGSWTHEGVPEGRARFIDACIEALQESGYEYLGREALIKAARERGAVGRATTMREWLTAHVAEKGARIGHHRQHGYHLVPARDHPGPSPPFRPADPPGPP